MTLALRTEYDKLIKAGARTAVGPVVTQAADQHVAAIESAQSVVACATEDDNSAAAVATRVANLTSGASGGIALRWGETVYDDGIADCLNGGAGVDWLFLLAVDCQYWLTQEDRVTSQ
jgi:hypothetical protein